MSNQIACEHRQISVTFVCICRLASTVTPTKDLRCLDYFLNGKRNRLFLSSCISCASTFFSDIESTLLYRYKYHLWYWFAFLSNCSRSVLREDINKLQRQLLDERGNTEKLRQEFVCWKIIIYFSHVVIFIFTGHGQYCILLV